MSFKLEDLIPSFERFFRTAIAVRICPRQITATEDILSLNTLTIGISLVIFIMARNTVAGASQEIEARIIAMVISALIAFVSGYVTLVVSPNQEGLALGRKWSAFFIDVWLASMIALIVVDGITVWTRNFTPSSVLIDAVFVPGALPPIVKNLIRAVLFSVIALGVVLIKTKRQDPDFSVLAPCSIASLALGLVMNSALLLMFVYGNLI